MTGGGVGGHRWAILGAGDISRQFASDLGNVEDGALVAVGSSSADHAATFAEEVGALRGHGSYEEAAADDVTVAYVGNNHNDHATAAGIAIDAGRHVLVEKPLAMSRAEAAALFERSRDRGVFAMEAMWTRFLPHIAAVRAALEDGAIGTVREARLTLGRDQRGSYDRIFDPHRAGGALLDMGIYPVSIAQMLLGPPDDVLDATARIEGGIDLETTITARYGPATVVITTAADRRLQSTAELEGDRGRLVVPDALHHADRFELHRDGDVEVVPAPFEGHGFEYEIREVQRCIEAGLLESPSWTHKDTLATHGVLDEVRRRIGLVYPFESGPPA
jgi:predicted dehydrogenase